DLTTRTFREPVIKRAMNVAPARIVSSLPSSNQKISTLFRQKLEQGVVGCAHRSPQIRLPRPVCRPRKLSRGGKHGAITFQWRPAASHGSGDEDKESVFGPERRVPP